MPELPGTEVHKKVFAAVQPNMPDAGRKSPGRDRSWTMEALTKRLGGRNHRSATPTVADAYLIVMLEPVRFRRRRYCARYALPPITSCLHLRLAVAKAMATKWRSARAARRRNQPI